MDIGTDDPAVHLVTGAVTTDVLNGLRQEFGRTEDPVRSLDLGLEVSNVLKDEYCRSQRGHHEDIGEHQPVTLVTGFRVYPRLDAALPQRSDLPSTDAAESLTR